MWCAKTGSYKQAINKLTLARKPELCPSSQKTLFKLYTWSMLFCKQVGWHCFLWAGTRVTLFCSVTWGTLARPHRLGSSYNWLCTTGQLVCQQNKVSANLCTILVLVDLIWALVDKQYNTCDTSTNCHVDATLTNVHRALDEYLNIKLCPAIWEQNLRRISCPQTQLLLTQ